MTGVARHFTPATMPASRNSTYSGARPALHIPPSHHGPGCPVTEADGCGARRCRPRSPLSLVKHLKPPGLCLGLQRTCTGLRRLMPNTTFATFVCVL